jgi:SAM-dependent methyltransferase
VHGSGPPLLLLPFFLAPSQWQPAVALLAAEFTVIEVGGPHIGGIAALEDRARAPTYRAMFRTLVELLAPAPDARVLDVGCGSGALDRVLAHQLGASGRIVAADLNAFFLKEARALAAKEGVAERIAFMEASATALPYDDASFDCVFSITVLEECDADKALAEMVRVVKPGGRVGVVVRAIDVPQWWNLDLPEAIARKASVPAQSVAPGGVADRSLYARMLGAGLTALQAFPSLITLDNPRGPIWRYREDAVLPQLGTDEVDVWHRATSAARADGLLMQAHAMHAAVARKP